MIDLNIELDKNFFEVISLPELYRLLKIEFEKTKDIDISSLLYDFERENGKRPIFYSKKQSIKVNCNTYYFDEIECCIEKIDWLKIVDCNNYSNFYINITPQFFYPSCFALSLYDRKYIPQSVFFKSLNKYMNIRGEAIYNEDLEREIIDKIKYDTAFYVSRNEVAGEIAFNEPTTTPQAEIDQLKQQLSEKEQQIEELNELLQVEARSDVEINKVRKLFDFKDVEHGFVSLYSLIEFTREKTGFDYNQIGRLLKSSFDIGKVIVYSNNPILNSYTQLNDCLIGDESALMYYINHLINNNGYEYETDYTIDEDGNPGRARVYEGILPFEGIISSTPTKESFQLIYINTDEIKSLNDNNQESRGNTTSLQTENEQLKQRITELEAQLQEKNESAVSDIVNYEEFSIYGHSSELLEILMKAIKKYWTNGNTPKNSEIEAWIGQEYPQKSYPYVSKVVKQYIATILRPQPKLK